MKNWTATVSFIKLTTADTLCFDSTVTASSTQWALSSTHQPHKCQTHGVFIFYVFKACSRSTTAASRPPGTLGAYLTSATRQMRCWWWQRGILNPLDPDRERATSLKQLSLAVSVFPAVHFLNVTRQRSSHVHNVIQNCSQHWPPAELVG